MKGNHKILYINNPSQKLLDLIDSINKQKEENLKILLSKKDKYFLK